MKKRNGIKNFAKLYICTETRSKEPKRILYHLFNNDIWVLSYKQIDDFNWMFEIEYNQVIDIKNVLGEHNVRGKKILVYRVFKSMKLYKKHNQPQRTFLDNILILISAKIKRPINLKVVNNNANDWQKELTKRWQNELDNPDKFKQLGIKPLLDISPKGEYIFHINKVSNYIITYFTQDIEGIYGTK